MTKKPKKPSRAQPHRPASSVAPPLGDAARHLACRALARQARRFPDLDLLAFEVAKDEGGANTISALDEAFARAIHDAAIERWLTLEYLLDRRLKQPMRELEPRMRAVLLAGAAQLVLLDKVPAHAAINHAVAWAKKVIRPGAGGMVNAVLRRVSELVGERTRRDEYGDGRDELPMPDGSALVLSEAVLPENELERLSVATSVPMELLTHWLRRADRQATGAPPTPVPRSCVERALHTLVEPPVVFNTMHARPDVPLHEALVPHGVPGHHVLMDRSVSPAAVLGERRGRTDIWVQDAASSAAVLSVRDLKPRVIVDACAGRGTKTRQLAAVFPEAAIIATDADQRRFADLQQLFKGHDRVHVVPYKTLRQRVDEISEGRGADLILLDVPCSNTGVLPRRPEAKYRFGVSHMKSLIDTQRQIIADAILLLRATGGGAPAEGDRKGPAILYSTCSLEDEENQAQAAWAEKWHGFRPQREQRTLPRGLPGEHRHDGPPGVAYHDGSYSVLLA